MQQTIRRNILLLIFGDGVSLLSALLIALIIRHGGWPGESVLIMHLIPFATLGALWLAVFFIAGLYDTHIPFIRRDIPDVILKAQVINMLFAALFFFVFPVGITPKTILALYLIVSTTLIVCWRLFLFPKMSTRHTTRAIIVGSGKEAKELSRVLNENPRFGCLCSEVVDIHTYPNAALIGEKLTELVALHDIESVIADMSDEYAKRLAPLYYNLTFMNASVRFIPLHEVYEQLFHRVPLSLIGKTWFLENVATGKPKSGYVFLKRLGDIVGALILLVPCVILFPFIMIAIRLQDGGASIYTSERVGQYNKLVYIFKFRSMTGMDSGATLDTKHTVTPLGRFLRRTRLDELPQLWNILQGDLSFVGPRPELPARARVYAETIPYYNMRHLIKPGLSGWAQINNFEVPRGEVDIAGTIDKLSFDLFYLKRHSFFFDLEIILKTIKTMLLRSGT
jgi:exopolysaccharide biosynthesis polyprenyl glycosylphosphotransferase